MHARRCSILCPRPLSWSRKSPQLLRVSQGSCPEILMANSNTVQISIAGRWVTLPAAQIEGTIVAVKGTWLRIAVIVDEDLRDSQVQDPEKALQQLKKGAFARCPDIFTFSQGLSDRVVKYSYPMEMESVAAVRIASFREWWE